MSSEVEIHGLGQRVRLAPGSHSSARQGVCVVELASMIAGEPFSDRPRCVCPVIASFLRAWNDRAGHADRQRLAPYAGRIVGSRRSRRLTRIRRDVCLEFAGAAVTRGRFRALFARLGMRARIALYCGVPEALRLDEGAGEYAARLAFARRDTDAAFRLLEALLGPATPSTRNTADASEDGDCHEQGRVRRPRRHPRLRLPGAWRLRRRPNPAREVRRPGQRVG